MNSLTIYLTANSLSADYVNFYGPFLIKGTTTASFNLYAIEEEINPVINVHGYFGDGVEYEDTLNLNLTLDALDAIVIAETGKVRSVKQTFSHAYEKNQSTFVDYLTASFALIYASQRCGIHNVSFVHVKDSYYDNIKQIHLNATQMMPVSSNDLIAVASTDSGDVFHLHLSRTALLSSSSSETASVSSYVLAPRTMKNCYTLHAQQGGILVPTLSA